MASIILFPWQDNKVEVIILDTYECGGVELATIEALRGKPFVGGDKWPVRTPWKVVKVTELVIIEIEDDLGECTCGPDDVMTCPVCTALIEKRLNGLIPFDYFSDRGQE